MCGRGRFSILANQRIRRYVRDGPTRRAADRVDSAVDRDYAPQQNISPGMSCPILLHEKDCRSIQYMIWGLIPHYTPKDEKPNHYALFNKRIESFEPSNKYYYSLLEKKRCVVIFDGFYEWKIVAGKKQPYYVHFGPEPLQLAGIYEDSYLPNSPTPVRTFSVVTCDPSEAFLPVYDRQPVFMTDEQVESWLNPDTPVEKLLEELKANIVDPTVSVNQNILFHPVAKKMVDATYQGDDCHIAITLGKKIESFFTRTDTLKSDEKSIPNTQTSSESIKSPTKNNTFSVMESIKSPIKNTQSSLESIKSPIPATHAYKKHAWSELIDLTDENEVIVDESSRQSIQSINSVASVSSRSPVSTPNKKMKVKHTPEKSQGIVKYFQKL
jgi:putative SOS response-associated peptidase YedK